MGTISYVNLFHHNLSIALPSAGSVHALSIATATLHSPPYPAILPPSPINSINVPFLLSDVHTSSPNAQHPLALHSHSTYRFSFVFPNHAISELQFSIPLSPFSTLPTYFSASYSQPLHTAPYIHNPLANLPIITSFDRPLASSLQTSLTFLNVIAFKASFTSLIVNPLRASTSSSYSKTSKLCHKSFTHFLAPVLQSSPSSTIYHWPFSSSAPKTPYFSSLLPASPTTCSSQTSGRPVDKVSPHLKRFLYICNIKLATTCIRENKNCEFS